LLLLLAIAIVILGRACNEEIRIATFNIENYPKSPEQPAAAFAMIAELDLDVLAVQEITDPSHFAAMARASLGPSWRFVHPRRGPEQRIGILYDRDRFDLLSVRELKQTIVYDGAKPALEARLRPRDGGDVLRIVTVHLKAGGEHFETRRLQLDALQPILRKAAKSDDRLVILGDFNATGDQDRSRIRTLADFVGIEWASEPLSCTSYWDRSDGCIGTALDHVLTSEDVEAEAMGPCRTEGCDRKDRCPIFHREVSDHCPVLIEL
jgi:endonuclease/exonuclease/phosphatase family metal-dependent hydrolase